MRPTGSTSSRSRPTGNSCSCGNFASASTIFSLEVPGGVIESGEDLVAAGVRELAEETGFAGGTARLLGSVHPNPAIQDNRCHCRAGRRRDPQRAVGVGSGRGD